MVCPSPGELSSLWGDVSTLHLQRMSHLHEHTCSLIGVHRAFTTGNGTYVHTCTCHYITHMCKQHTLRTSSFPESKLFGSKPPTSTHPPTFLPPSHGDLSLPRRLPAEPEEAQTRCISSRTSLPCQKSSRVGQMPPLSTLSCFPSPPPSWVWGVPLGKADLLRTRSRAEDVDGIPCQATPPPPECPAAESCPLKHRTPGQAWGEGGRGRGGLSVSQQKFLKSRLDTEHEGGQASVVLTPWGIGSLPGTSRACLCLPLPGGPLD